MKLFPSLLGGGGGTTAVSFLLLLVGRTPAALAKDLSIGLLHRDWTIEKKCSAELDQVQAALLAHVVANTTTTTSSDDDKNKNNKASFSSLQYDCAKVCPPDMANALCQHITRGYCSSTSGTTNDRAQIDHEDDDHVVVPPADLDVTTLDCDTYCQDVPHWLCRRITYGHCTTTAGTSSRTIAATTTTSATEDSLAPPPYYCPTFCQDVPTWVCARISNGSCTGREEYKDSTTTATAIDMMLSSFSVHPAVVSYYKDCTKICKDLPNWVCRRVSRGYCKGLYDESSSTASIQDGLVDQLVHRSNKAAAATIPTPTPAGTITAAANTDLNPFHCVSYCADLPSWLCHRVTAGKCTGGERRGLSDADTFDELLLRGPPNLPVPTRDAGMSRQLSESCDSICQCLSIPACRAVTSNRCYDWNPYRDNKVRDTSMCPFIKGPTPRLVRAAHRPTRPTRRPVRPVRATRRPTRPTPRPVRATRRPVWRPTPYPLYNVYNRPGPTPYPMYNVWRHRDLQDGGADHGGASAPSLSSNTTAAGADATAVAEVVQPPLSDQVPPPIMNGAAVVAAADMVQTPVAVAAAPLQPPLQEPPMSYHCPTYCRRVPPSLCARLTYGYCGSLEDGGAEKDNKGDFFFGHHADGAAGNPLRGSSSSANSAGGGGGGDHDDNDCNAAIATMADKFGALVGDLDDQECAAAIMKANIKFQCSPTDLTTTTTTTA